MNFTDLKIISPLLKTLEKAEFTKPTEIQEKVIPLANKNKDILGCAQTWSGKTLAFALPVLEKMYNKRLEEWKVEGKHHRQIKTLILAPTRELAGQIADTFKPYCTNTNFKATVIYWWVNDFHQIKAIEKWVDILIATPWRLMDLVSQGVVNLSFVDTFILDEADRMLDMWNGWDINKVIKRLRWERQTMLFSATMPKKIRDLAKEILNNPEEITVHWVSTTVEKITQQVLFVKSSHKRQALQQQVKRKDVKSIIVFVRSRTDAERILWYVKTAWIPAESIHKDKSQNQRQNALRWLKEWKIKVLVATDIASRGLDVTDLSLVINYDIPLNPEDYVHRIGRTGRAGKNWLALSLCIELDKEKLENIEKLIARKLDIIDDDSYLKEIVPKERVEKKVEKRVWRTRFESTTYSRWNKKKNTKKTDSKKKPRRWWGKKVKRHYGK